MSGKGDGGDPGGTGEADDEFDPSDWLAKQFGVTDDDEPPAPSTSSQPAPPPIVPPTLSNPPAAPPSPGGFPWGLAPGADPAQAADARQSAPREPLPPLPPVALPPVVPPPVDPQPVDPPPVDPQPADPLAAFLPPAQDAPPPADPPTRRLPLPESPEPAPGAAIPDAPITDTPITDTPTTALPANWFSDPQAEEPPPVDAAVPGPPLPGAEPPTTVFPWETVTPAAPADPPTELLDAGPGTMAIDSLFGDQQFKEYAGESLLANTPFVAPRDEDAAAPKGPRGPLPRNQRILLWVAGSVVAVLALVTLFLVGTKLPDVLGPAPAVAITSTPTVTPTPTPTAVPTGPVAAGEHKWNELRGGECLGAFTSPWAETFTVADCATAHPAQMVYRGTFPPIAAPAPASTATPGATSTAQAADPNAYPGMDALQSQIAVLCSAPTVIDLAAAGQYSDIQFQAAYAVSAKEWADGDHDYYCFVTRSSGDPLTGSVSAVKPAG